MSFNWEYCPDIKTTFISIQPLQAYTARPKSAIPINYIAPAAIWYFDPGVNFHPWYIALPYWKLTPPPYMVNWTPMVFWPPPPISNQEIGREVKISCVGGVNLPWGSKYHMTPPWNPPFIQHFNDKLQIYIKLYVQRHVCVLHLSHW